MSVERDSGSVCRVRKCLFREKERENVYEYNDRDRVCVSIEREKSVRKKNSECREIEGGCECV